MPASILLIDDNLDQFTITKRTLAQTGADYRVEAAKNAAEGLEKLRANRYDIVLCDYRLPDRTGIEVLTDLQHAGNLVPFIIVTSAGNERLAVEAIQLGADDYVVKDSSYDHILPTVLRRALQRAEDRQAREHLQVERDQALEALKHEKAGLERMNEIMMDREERVLELKNEVNALLEKLGKPAKY